MTVVRDSSWSALALAVFLWTSHAAAHPVGVSRGEYVVREGNIYAGVTFARRELAEALPWLKGRDGDESVLAFEQNRERLGSWLVERLSASERRGTCSGTFDGMRFDDDAVALALSYRCPEGIGPFELDARFVRELGRGHRHLVTLIADDDRREAVATSAHTIASFERPTPEQPASETDTRAAGRAPPSSTSGSFGAFARMGVEHILTGYDHLLFLLGLVLIGGPIRSLIAAITAFTVAHSITLGVASLGVWSPSPHLVEPCIALSIAYVGVENWFVDDARGRWRITFPFGLVHGFGFAGALHEIALPRPAIPAALFAFNLGVELGQAALLAALFPLVYLARKQNVWSRVGMRACTMAIALVGVVWFISRVRGSL
jgi:hydrogenase/urease accessory protein HupE